MARRKSLGRILKKYESSKITKDELKRHLQLGEVGRVTGIIGPFVLRYHNGKLIISERVRVFRKSMSPAAVAGRNNFSAKIKFVKFLNSIEPIREIWKQVDVEGKNGWTKLIKHTEIKGLHPTAKNTITPDIYHFEIEQICTLEEDLHFKINYCPDEQETLLILIVPYDPIGQGNPFEILQVSGTELNEDQIEICRKYRRFILFSAVIRINGNEIEWSNTAVTEGYFESDKPTRDGYILLWIFLRLLLIKHINNSPNRRLSLLKVLGSWRL